MTEIERISAEAFRVGTVSAHAEARRQLESLGAHAHAVPHEYEATRLLRESFGVRARKEPLKEKAEYSNRHRELLEMRNAEAKRILSERSAHRTQLGHPAHQQAALREAHALVRGPKGGSFYLDKGRKVYSKR